jgi:hypothetical protein
MATIYGALGLADTDRVFNDTVGQRLIYETTLEWFNRVNAEVNDLVSFFSAGRTDQFKWRFKLPGSGMMQPAPYEEQGRPHAVKPSGYWDVSLPLKGFQDAVLGTDIALRYMTAADLDLAMKTITARYARTVWFKLMYAIFNGAAWTFPDPIQGNLSIVPLANTDGTLYPPTIASDTPADDNHLLESGYASSAISDANNPYVTIRNELTEHFGEGESGQNILVLIHPDQEAKTLALTNFIELTDDFVRPGDDTSVLIGRPQMPASFKLLGRTDGVWVASSQRMPTGYLFGRHLSAPAPLMQRTDPADTGIPPELTMVFEDEEYPFKSMYWRARIGFGVTNRLNGVVMELGTGGTYTAPTTYA